MSSFPSLTEAEKETNYWLLECSRCKGRETVESDNQTVDKAVVRTCKRCGCTTTHERVLGDEGQHECHPEASVAHS